MVDRYRCDGELGNFLPVDRPSVWFRWPGQMLALLCALTVTVGGLHLITGDIANTPDTQAVTGSAENPSQVARAAAAAFAESPFADPAVDAVQRGAGLPENPVTGLTAHTPAGPVELVLPGGLGAAQRTPAGMVVYPDAGAGFDFLAENTTTGTRTIARILDAGGPRVVTTFVRTPADTVMLAHTNGYLTLNRATAAAETIGMFSPAETRDAAGKLVPSSYVVRQLRPQLYQLSEVIDPRPDTVWPVYVDPPLHLSGPGGAALPQFSFSDITDAVSGAASAVADAAATAASATVSGAKSVGTFVKNNPLESAMLVGGVALAVTGVGGPAGAAMIAGATVNIASAGVDIAAAAMPDNQALGIASNVLGAASIVTPQGAAKKAVKEGVEIVAEQVAKHADDVVDVAKVAPTPPAALADEVANAATNPVKPGSGTPKIPTGPPGAEALPSTGTGKSFTQVQKDRGSADALGVPPGTRGSELDRLAGESGTNLACANCGSRVFLQEGGRTVGGDKVPPVRAHFDHNPIPKSQGGTGANSSKRNILCQGCNLGKGDLPEQRWNAMRRDVARQSRADVRAYLRVYGQRPKGVIRSPNERVDTPGQQQRWTRYETERAAERSKVGRQSGPGRDGAGQRSGSERKNSDAGGKRKASKKNTKKTKSKKKDRKKKSGHKKKQQRKARGN